MFVKLLVAASGDRLGHTAVGLSSQESLVVESRALLRRVRRPASSLVVESSRWVARRRVGLLARRVAWRCSSAHKELVEAARHCAPPPESSSSHQRQFIAASAGLVAASHGRPPRSDSRNRRVRLFVTAVIVASWSSISKQLIAQQVVASGAFSSRQKAARRIFSSGGCCHRATIVASKANSWSHEKHDRRRLEAVRRRDRRPFNIVPGGQSAYARGQWRTACSSLQLVIAEASLQGSLSCQGCLPLAASRELVNRKSSSPHRWTDLVSRVVSECSLVVVATRPSRRTGSRLQSLVVPRPSRYSSSRAQEF